MLTCNFLCLLENYQYFKEHSKKETAENFAFYIFLLKCNFSALLSDKTQSS